MQNGAREEIERIRGIRHGADGWVLVSYRWREHDEVGVFVYEREIRNGLVETEKIFRPQPLIESLRGL